MEHQYLMYVDVNSILCDVSLITFMCQEPVELIVLGKMTEIYF